MSSEKFLSLEEITNAEKVRFATVDAWGGRLRLGSLTAAEMMEWVEGSDGPDKKTAGLRLVTRSLVDGAGNRIGNDQFIEVLRNKDSRTINEILEAIFTLNGLRLKRDAAKNG